MDAFEKIKNRRRNFEGIIPIASALLLSSFYALLRWRDERITTIIFITAFAISLVVQGFSWQIFGFKRRDSDYKPKVNYTRAIFYTISIIVIMEVIQYVK